MIFKFVPEAIGRIARSLAGPVGIAALLMLAVTAGTAQAQTGFDRHGGDYTSFQVRSGDPAVCAQRCDREARCRSWSFAYPGTIGPRAMCWLKAGVPARKEDTCCVSGVRGGGVVEPRTGPIEYGIDRAGGDYKSFETTPHADGNLCATACNAESRCRAWTYVRAGYFTPTARCYLKSRVTPPRRKPCCISGVVR